MARTVFVLGAGASREGGGPLMNDFVSTAETLFRQGKIPEHHRTDFELLLRAREKLQAAHVKAHLDLTNIESVLGAFEMAQVLGRLADLDPQEVKTLAPAMRTVIATTLERRIQFRRTSDAVLPPMPYDNFAELIGQAGEADIGPVSIISFNYDVGADYALHRRSIPLDYGLGARIEGAVPLLKLHGAINWAKCCECDEIQILGPEQFFPDRRRRAPLAGAGLFNFLVTDGLGQLQHHNKPCVPEAVIVPPTWNKMQYHRLIEAVWRRAAEEMSGAENIVVIGYSLPPTDEFFRYLFALGCIGPRLLRQILVCDPNPEVLRHFEVLLASSTRGGLRHVPRIFSETFGEVRAIL